MRFLRRAGLVLAGALLVTVVSVSTALAGFVPRVAVKSESDGTATVLVNNRTAIRFVVKNGRLEPLQRAQITVDRLRALVASGISPSAIGTKPVGPKSWIMCGDSNICIVTPSDAKRNNSSVDGMAEVWASRLRTLLAMPAVELNPAEITVPVSEARTVRVEGAAVGPISLSASTPEVAACELSPTGRVVVIGGKTVGDAKLVVTCEGESAAVVIHVRTYAGRVAQPPSAQVTGHPAPSWVLGQVALSAVKKSLQVEEGATAQIGSPKLPEQSLKPGAKMVVQVPVRIQGGGHIPVSTTAPVEVQNLNLVRKPVDVLLYSNDPESVSRYQTLYSGQIRASGVTRLLYHHQNDIGKRLKLNIEILNRSDKSAKLHLTAALAGPVVDTVLVGYKAGSKFMREYVNHIGYVVDIPAGSKYILYSGSVEPAKTASGIVEFRELAGQNLDLRVGADIPQASDYRGAEVASLTSNDRVLSPSGEIYPSPLKQLRASYRVGDRWTFIPMGKYPIKDYTSTKHLYGNYGVIYEMRIQIKNPTGAARKVSVLFEPGAGLAGGVFFINGRFVETKYVNPPQEFTIAEYQLAPNQTKLVSILTIPLAGSAYPANILVRS